MFKGILADIDSIKARDPAVRSRLEVLLCYPGYHAVLIHRLAHAFGCATGAWAAVLYPTWAVG